MAGYVVLQIDQNADFKRVITIKDSTGDPQNLVSSTVNTAMRRSYTSLTYTSIPTTITNASQGELTIAMNGSETANISAGRYVYDVLVVYPDGSKQRLLEGVVVVNPGVTR